MAPGRQDIGLVLESNPHIAPSYPIFRDCCRGYTMNLINYNIDIKGMFKSTEGLQIKHLTFENANKL